MACADYVLRLGQAGIQPSMSRVGCPWKNTMAESVMKTLKAEEVGRTPLKAFREGIRKPSRKEANKNLRTAAYPAYGAAAVR